jgi:hypothetical protein
MSDGTDVQAENKLLYRTTFKLQIKITYVECKYYTIYTAKCTQSQNGK